uniref:Uncharacterized protein n=1 Tax=Nelumbo nucifera TaxID=4432 RepID=A0A822Z4E1_NELNU|nr:TPA_asm: hypothetical protein HUJ06_014010 [Nelumbo nucifera]
MEGSGPIISHTYFNPSLDKWVLQTNLLSKRRAPPAHFKASH